MDLARIKLALGRFSFTLQNRVLLVIFKIRFREDTGLVKWSNSQCNNVAYVVVGSFC